MIESKLAPAEVVDRLAAVVSPARGFWGWVDFWLRWDGLKTKIKFAGTVDAESFALRRVHGLRFMNFVSVKARGQITATGAGSHVVVTVSPTLEEFWFMAAVIPLALSIIVGASSFSDAALPLVVAVGIPLTWFFWSRSRESAETERQLRALLSR